MNFATISEKIREQLSDAAREEWDCQPEQGEYKNDCVIMAQRENIAAVAKMLNETTD